MECLYKLDYIAQIEGITKIIWLVYIHGYIYVLFTVLTH